MKECALATLIKGFEQVRMQYFPESKFTIVLEAQQVSRLHRFSFLPAHDPNKFRSILREIIKVFSCLGVKIVVAGIDRACPWTKWGMP